MPPIASTAIALVAQPDSGSSGYVVAAVVVSALVVLVYLVIVALRVRDAAERLDRLEEHLDRPERGPAVDDELRFEDGSEALRR